MMIKTEVSKWYPINKDGYKFPWNKPGIRMFREGYWPNELTPLDDSRLIRLCLQCLVGKDNFLGYDTRSGAQPINAVQVGKHIGLKPSQAKAWVKRMVDLHIFAKVFAGDRKYKYLVNPATIIKDGNRLTPEQYKLFSKEIDPLLTRKMRARLKKLGWCEDGTKAKGRLPRVHVESYGRVGLGGHQECGSAGEGWELPLHR